MFIEGDLVFDFRAAMSCVKLDKRGIDQPQGMSFVDFYVELNDSALLVEVKDPCNASAQDNQRQEFIRKLTTDTLINHSLVPKCRDSYTYLHLMEQDKKPITYVVLLAIDCLSIDPALLLSVRDRILARVRKEAQLPWKRNYVSDCVVVDLQTWSKHLPFTCNRATQNEDGSPA